MVIPLSQLDRFTLTCIQKVQAARAAALPEIPTEAFEMTFSVQVYDDTQQPIEVSSSEQILPEGKQTTTKGPSKSTQTQKKDQVITKEEQASQPSTDVTTQTFGRGSTTSVSVTT